MTGTSIFWSFENKKVDQNSINPNVDPIPFSRLDWANASPYKKMAMAKHLVEGNILIGMKEDFVLSQLGESDEEYNQSKSWFLGDQNQGSMFGLMHYLVVEFDDQRLASKNMLTIRD